MRRSILKRILRQPGGLVGTALLLFVLFVAFVGPLLAPDSPTAPLGVPSGPPGNGFFFGTDFLGRDVLSRLLNGGRSVIFIGLSATLIAYLVGVLIGVYAGYRSGLGDAFAMRTVDIILAFPPLLILLLLVGGLGQHTWVLILGVIVVHVPGISRITRTASLSVTKMSYVEAAQARGDKTFVIWRRDLIPNILPTLLADFGIRFSVSIVIVASMNYLGLGLAPPASDWGLMTSENQAAISLNPSAVLAPAVMLALLTVSINLIADAYVRAVTGSGVAKLLKAGRRRTGPKISAGPLGQPAGHQEANP